MLRAYDMGQRTGRGYHRRNPRDRPADKVIWNHFRMDQDLGHMKEEGNSTWSRYRSGFIREILPKTRSRHAA